MHRSAANQRCWSINLSPTVASLLDHKPTEGARTLLVSVRNPGISQTETDQVGMAARGSAPMLDGAKTEEKVNWSFDCVFLRTAL
jgi:hypothetical protein